MTNDIIEIKEKILFLHQRGIKAHVNTNKLVKQKDGSLKYQFYNGLIRELSDAWFLIEDEYYYADNKCYPTVWITDVKEVKPFIFPKEESK